MVEKTAGVSSDVDQLAVERRLASIELSDAKAEIEDLKKQLQDSGTTIGSLSFSIEYLS